MLSVPPRPAPDGKIQLHASTVVVAGAALAFVGPSGTGKSGMALAAMSRGAVLLADDITWLDRQDDHITATCPPKLVGRIEARGIGILSATPAPPAPLRLIVDLGLVEPDRLPSARSLNLLGCDVPVLHRSETPHFIDAILQYMKAGPAAP